MLAYLLLFLIVTFAFLRELSLLVLALLEKEVEVEESVRVKGVRKVLVRRKITRGYALFVFLMWSLVAFLIIKSLYDALTSIDNLVNVLVKLFFQ